MKKTICILAIMCFSATCFLRAQTTCSITAFSGASRWLTFSNAWAGLATVESSPAMTHATWSSPWSQFTAFSMTGLAQTVQVPVAGTQGFLRVVVDPPPPPAPASMVAISSGTFQMGDSFSEGDASELPVHAVLLSACHMDATAVSWAQWQNVYNWAVTNGYQFGAFAGGKATNHPVQSVSWYDAVKWCNARSEMDGRTPAYYTDGTFATVYRTGQIDIASSAVKWHAGYRLPTEAEWECAARGGVSGQRFPWGNTISHTNADYHSAGSYSYDNGPTGYDPVYNDGYEPYTCPVDAFAPNAFGLYNMAGNVGEWCWDWFDVAYYFTSTSVNPQGPASGNGRVTRGGAWDNPSAALRVSARGNYQNPGNFFDDCGFRTVLPF